VDQIFGVTLLALQLLSCILIVKSVKNKNYITYRFPRCGRRAYTIESFAKFGLICCFILTSITVLSVLFDPEFGGVIYLDCKNFYLQTTPEGMIWANFLAVSHQASYKDILKFSYDPRGDFDTDLTWLVVKTNHGKTLRFDPLLTGAGLLIPQLAFRVENGYWAKNADPEDQQLLQNFIDEPEKARELLMSCSPCVIER